MAWTAATSANDSAPQNSTSSRPASIAPGTMTMIALSISSISAMLAVSDASAIGTTVASATADSTPPEVGSGSWW